MHLGSEHPSGFFLKEKPRQKAAGESMFALVPF
jgi:hypothetical protein